MSSAGKAALEYLKSIFASASADHLPDTQPWLTAVPGDAARDRGMTSGADQRAVETDDDVIEFVTEWYGKRNIYFKPARFDFDAPGPRIASTRVFVGAWLDLDLVAKPGVAPQNLIDMACAALDKLKHPPSVIVSTGGGLQALFHFDEPLVVGTTVDVNGAAIQAHILIENTNRELARVFAGDTAVCHPAGGLRLPFTQNVNRAGVVARTLRVEPGRVCKAVDLYAELCGLGVMLAKAKDGSWATPSAAMSKAERVHAEIARLATGAGGGKPRLTPEEQQAIIDGMVIESGGVKGGRDNATTSYAGTLINDGLTDDECLANILARIPEAVARVRAAGGKPDPLSRAKIMQKIRNVRKKHDRGRVGEGDVKPLKREALKVIGAGDPTPDAMEPVSMDKLDIGFDLDPGKFFATWRDTPEPGRAGHADENDSESDDLDPADYDPSREPATVAELRWVVKLWRAKASAKGVPNAGKEYPYGAPGLIETVKAVWLRTLDKAGTGVAWDNAASQWWVYRPASWVWDRASFDVVDAMLSRFLVRVLGHACKARLRREFLTTIAPSLAPVAAWNLPAAMRQHVTLCACGTLVLIDHAGGLTVRVAKREDLLTAEGCPRIAASWVPGATCPEVDKVIAVIMARPDAAERTALIETYWAAASQILLPGERPKATYRAVFVWGEANTGKSALLEIVRAVLEGHPEAGRASPICSTSLEDFDGAFGRSGMLGCRAWLVHETIDGYRVKNEATFKQITVNEPITVNVKYREPVLARLGMPIFIATNNLPNWGDASKGTSSRVVAINTTTEFVPATDFKGVPGTAAINPDLYEDMVRENAGVLQKMAVAACAMVRAGVMPVADSVRAMSDATFTENDPVAEFVLRGVAKAPTPDHWAEINGLVRGLRGMVDDAGGGRAGIDRMSTLGARQRLLSKLRFMFKGKAWIDRADGGSGDPMRTFHGVWLTAKGKEWAMMAMRRDDGNNQPLSSYRLLVERVNGPHINPRNTTAQPVSNGVANVVVLKQPGLVQRD